jgi:peroxiredoxin
MKAYQAGMQKFQDAGAKVFGISTDNTPSLKEFVAKLIYLPKYGIANRVTFVIDKDGKIDFIEQGGDAVKIMGAGDACSRLAHKKAQ